VKETHAYALFPGGFGTMDEGFEALTLMQTGKALIIPIVLIDRPDGSYWENWMRFLTDHLLKLGLISKEDFNFIKIAHHVPDAVNHILLFYRNYSSSRWVGSQLVLRICKRLTKKALTELNKQFSDLLRSGRIRRSLPCLLQRAKYCACSGATRASLRSMPRLAPSATRAFAPFAILPERARRRYVFRSTFSFAQRS
jgi:hypothetical protein